MYEQYGTGDWIIYASTGQYRFETESEARQWAADNNVREAPEYEPGVFGFVRHVVAVRDGQ